jgi:5'-nucleotidase
MVRRYSEAAAPIAARVVGSIAPAAEEGVDCLDTSAVDLVADAQLAAAKQALGEHVDVAFINTSGVRTGLAGADDGVMTYGEIFAMQPFGNVLQVLELSGSQMLAALEEQFCNEGPATTCFTLLAPSANMSYAYDRSLPRGQRIVEVEIDGRPLDETETYQAVFNNFLASGGDGFASLASRRTVGEAGSDIDALEAYLARGATIPTCGRRLRDLTPG